MNNKIVSKEQLVDVALGALPADIVIKGGNLVNVLTREIYKADIVIFGNRVAATGACDYQVSPDTKIIDASGKWIAPGFMDPHMHLESTAITVTELAKRIVPRGVTTVVEDPHEFANVLGVKGIKLFFEEAKGLPLRFLLRVPGHVPAMPPEIETSGAEITVEETKELLGWDEAVQLAGDINPELILSKDPEQFEKIDCTIRLNKTVGGQSPALQGSALNAFIAAGPEDSHVSFNLDEVIDIQRHGLKAILTPKPFLFGPENYGELAELIKEKNIDIRNIMFCTDDRQSDYLYRSGHLDGVVRLAIERGIEPVTAIQMATINVAEHLRLDRDFGSIAPGKIADLMILDDLETISVSMVLVDGEIVAENGCLVTPPPAFEYPAWAKDTVHLPKSVKPEDLQIRVAEESGTAKARVLVAGVPKEMEVKELRVEGGVVMPDETGDILSMAVLERHKNTGNIGRAFIRGTGICDGAIAGSVSHDAHNIYVIGTNYEYMALAANRVAEMGGGFAAVKAGEIVTQIELPIGGLISEEPLETVAGKFEYLEKEILQKGLNCTLQGFPLFTLSVISLPNIPNWGITDKGLIEVRTMRHMDPICE